MPGKRRTKFKPFTTLAALSTTFNHPSSSSADTDDLSTIMARELEVLQAKKASELRTPLTAKPIDTIMREEVTRARFKEQMAAATIKQEQARAREAEYERAKQNTIAMREIAAETAAEEEHRRGSGLSPSFAAPPKPKVPHRRLDRPRPSNVTLSNFLPQAKFASSIFAEYDADLWATPLASHCGGRKRGSRAARRNEAFW